MPLSGPDAQALEGALQQVERELAETRSTVLQEVWCAWNSVSMDAPEEVCVAFARRLDQLMIEKE